MKARKCPASRNCTAWSGTMKLNRICFSEIASRMIKGAAGRRWWSPSTEATSVTPSFTPYTFWLFLIFCSFPLTSRLLSPSWSFPPLCCVPALSLKATPGCFREQGAHQHHSLGPWVCPNTPGPVPPPYPHTALFIPLLFGILCFGSRKLIHIMQHRVPSSARWNRAMLPKMGAAPCSATALLVGCAVRIPSVSPFPAKFSSRLWSWAAKITSVWCHRNLISSLTKLLFGPLLDVKACRTVWVNLPLVLLWYVSHFVLVFRGPWPHGCLKMNCKRINNFPVVLLS